MYGVPCPVCARRIVEMRQNILSDELAATWELSPQWRTWFDDREGTHCPLCLSSRRSQFMAASLIRHVNERMNLSFKSLRELTDSPAFHNLAVAELNSCGCLHPWLAHHPRLAYSEYKATPPIRSEDLLALSYADQTFDIVLTSETLEHVPNITRALSELYRILKPGGVHIFTVPVVWERPTSRTCANLDSDGKLLFHRPPSYHGIAGTAAADMMVFTEFGADIIGTLEMAGFETSVERDPENPALCTFVTRRPQ